MKQRKRAKPNTPETYLWPKPGARYWWFRLSVPVRYRRVETRRLIQRNLYTTDRRRASLLAAELRVELTRGWEAALGQMEASGTPVIPSDADLQRAAATIGHIRMPDSVAVWWQDAKDTDRGSHTLCMEMLERRRRRYIEHREDEDAGLWDYAAKSVLREFGWTLPDGEKQRQFAQMIAESVIDGLRVQIEHKDGNFSAEPGSRIVRAGLEQIASAALPGETISDLFERYAKQRLAEKHKRPDTIEQDRKIIERFAAFVGSKRSVRSIQPAEVRDFRDAVASLPPMYAAAKTYQGLSIREAGVKAQTGSGKRMSPTTVNKYLSTVSPFLAWCVRNAYADKNPCDGLFYDLKKGENPRPPFTPDQLRQIVASPLFTGCEGEGKEHLPGTCQVRDWRYWIPLVCLFTGARISEVAQLRVEDVQHEGEHPFIHIRHDEKASQTTKSARSRIAPIHLKLAQVGFLKFVDERKATPSTDRRLFPELSPNSRGNVGATASRFWRDYLKRIGLKSGADGLGAHSFRHLFADRLRLAGYLNEEIKVILGHSQKSVTSGYGRLSEGTAQRLGTMINRIAFEEIESLIGQSG